MRTVLIFFSLLMVFSFNAQAMDGEALGNDSPCRHVLRAVDDLSRSPSQEIRTSAFRHLTGCVKEAKADNSHYNAMYVPLACETLKGLKMRDGYPGEEFLTALRACVDSNQGKN